MIRPFGMRNPCRTPDCMRRLGCTVLRRPKIDVLHAHVGSLTTAWQSGLHYIILQADPARL